MRVSWAGRALIVLGGRAGTCRRGIVPRGRGQRLSRRYWRTNEVRFAPHKVGLNHIVPHHFFLFVLHQLVSNPAAHHRIELSRIGNRWRSRLVGGCFEGLDLTTTCSGRGLGVVGAVALAEGSFLKCDGLRL